METELKENDELSIIPPIVEAQLEEKGVSHLSEGTGQGTAPLPGREESAVDQYQAGERPDKLGLVALSLTASLRRSRRRYSSRKQGGVSSP
jgi:hypothetical protein